MPHATSADDFRSQFETQSFNPQDIDLDPSLHDPTLQRLLRAHLLALPYGSFLQVVARLLECQGGASVRPMGREGFVGRNRSGGWDMEANLPAPSELTRGLSQAHTTFNSHTHHRARCLVQVKQFDQLAVQQRTVDELRGCCLRAGAGRGLILTTSRFSPVAQAAAEASPLAPITLIDGERLGALLLQHKLGVRQGPDGGWRIDPEFFSKLGKAANSKAKVANHQAERATGTQVGGRHSSQADPFQSQSHQPKSCTPTASSSKPTQTRVLHLSIAVGPILFDPLTPSTGPGRRRRGRNDNDPTDSGDQDRQDDQNHRNGGGQ